MTQNVLFYSKRCQHCNEVIDLIQKHGIGNFIQFACIDTMPRAMIPKMVSSVPTIMTPEKTFMADVECFNYIAQLGKISQQSHDPMAYNDGCGLTSQFESLEDPHRHQGGFYFIEGNAHPNITPPVVHDGKKSVSDTQLEKMMEERNADIKNIFGQNPPLRR